MSRSSTVAGAPPRFALRLHAVHLLCSREPSRGAVDTTMRVLELSMLALCFFAPVALGADKLCFSPVKERVGDVSSKRSFWQRFDYRIQVDDGPVVVPSAERSTAYEFNSEEPLVKIWLGDKVVESFRVRREWVTEGRTCIYFKNQYETWSVVEKWQAEQLCGCSE